MSFVPLRSRSEGRRGYKVKTFAHLPLPFLRRTSLGHGNIPTSKAVAVEIP